MSATFLAGDPAELFPFGPKPHILLGEEGDFDGGDGFKSILTLNHLYVNVRIGGDETLVAIPIEAILNGLQSIHKEKGN